jgi:HPt (histidine-containing phosphotransfer) domain-containing protein
VNSPAGIFVAPAPAAVELQVQDWDETAALAALNSQRNHLIALRAVPGRVAGVRDAVEQAVDQHDERQLRSQLHRLQASCGFVGAARLGRAVRQLHHAPESGQAQAGSARGGCPAALRVFGRAAPCTCRGFRPRQQQQQSGIPWDGGAVSECGDAVNRPWGLGSRIHAADTPSDTAPPLTVSAIG